MAAQDRRAETGRPPRGSSRFDNDEYYSLRERVRDTRWRRRLAARRSLDHGYRIADRIHNTGQAIVWSGPKEPAEHYWEQLNDAGLTMAPLERS